MNHSQIILNGIETDQLLDAVRQIVRTELESAPKQEKAKLYIDIEELSELIHWSKSKIYQGTYRREIPGVIKRGGKLLFNRETIIKWLNEAEETASSLKR